MKKIYILFFVFIPFIGISQNSTITGVVTYFFNKYQGNKPDIGAEVFILDSIQNPEFDYDLYLKFHNAQFYRSLYSSYLVLRAQDDELLKFYGNKKRYAAQIEAKEKDRADVQKYIDEYYAKMIKYDAETKEKFDTIDKTNFDTYYKVIHKDIVTVKAIGANGDYSVRVKPGVYYVFIRSKNRTGLNSSEMLGKIYCKKINIKDGQSKDVSYNFDVD